MPVTHDDVEALRGYLRSAADFVDAASGGDAGAKQSIATAWNALAERVNSLIRLAAAANQGQVVASLSQLAKDVSRSARLAASASGTFFGEWQGTFDGEIAVAQIYADTRPGAPSAPDASAVRDVFFDFLGLALGGYVLWRLFS